MFSAAGFAATYYVPGDYSTIQGAIDAAVSDDTIIVSQGTYVENINFGGKDIVLASIDPQNPAIIESTIIDGGQNGSVVTFSGGETSNCILSGFTITNGYAGNGGGVYGNSTQVTITSCTIIGNTAYYSGGGLYDCDGTIVSCNITGNTASNNGGGLYWCDGSITNCTITNNTAGFRGGGLIYCDGSITNCAISGNTANIDGGGLWHCDGTITNCTVTGNTANNDGGGLYVCDNSITNCIIWGNNAVNSGDQIYIDNSSIPTYSCIQDWAGGGTGNISDAPLFANPAQRDLHLLSGSPCIDTGTNTPPGGLPATDIEGAARPFDGNIDSNSVADMGAYEFHYDLNKPYIHIWPKLFSFSTFEAGSNPNDKTLTITNFGNPSLTWSMDLSDMPGWLTIAPTSGTLGYGESEPVTLSLDTTGLGDGLHSYVFDIVDPAAQNSPQEISIYLAVGGVIVPGDYPTIQTAIDGVSDGYTVIVLPGVYYENINFGEKNIILTSTAPTDPNVVVSLQSSTVAAVIRLSPLMESNLLPVFYRVLQLRMVKAIIWAAVLTEPAHRQRLRIVSSATIQHCITAVDCMIAMEQLPIVRSRAISLMAPAVDCMGVTEQLPTVQSAAMRRPVTPAAGYLSVPAQSVIVRLSIIRLMNLAADCIIVMVRLPTARSAAIRLRRFMAAAGGAWLVAMARLPTVRSLGIRLLTAGA